MHAQKLSLISSILQLISSILQLISIVMAEAQDDKLTPSVSDPMEDGKINDTEATPNATDETPAASTASKKKRKKKKDKKSTETGEFARNERLYDKYSNMH